MFCESKDLLFNETLAHVIKAAEDPKTALLMSLTGTEIDKPAENAWAAQGVPIRWKSRVRDRWNSTPLAQCKRLDV